MIININLDVRNSLFPSQLFGCFQMNHNNETGINQRFLHKSPCFDTWPIGGDVSDHVTGGANRKADYWLRRLLPQLSQSCLTVVVRVSNHSTPRPTTMFTTITNYFWGEAESQGSQEQESAPGAQEVEDWIVVGGTPKDFQQKSEPKSKPSPRKNSSKQRLQSLMFGEAPVKEEYGSWKNNPSGKGNHQYKANFSIKMAGNRNLKQC